MKRMRSPKTAALVATALALAAAIGCGDQEPEVSLGKLVRPPPVNGGGGAGGDEWQAILVHERQEIMYFECMRDMPVCGTDGVRYPNPCQAKQAGVEVDVDGGC
jgi:hypothetical protein